MSWIKKAFFAALAVLVLFVGARFFLYWKDYRFYADLALKEAPQGELTTLSNPEEGIVVLTGDRNRIRVAIDLLLQRGSQFLIISGIGKGTTLTDLINAQTASTLDLKVIWDKVILEAQSTSTIENAIECAKILRTKKVTRVILVTSDYHMSRSLALFKKFSPEVDYVVHPTPSEFTEALQGKMDHAFEGLYKFVYEFLKDSLFTFYLLSV
ncbi:MAG: YdcF family protein [Proteobacteria bacterium]|nr:YdcF family protein [Pseudomonadota bacterium]NBY21260.1 YdcF family protein [bacterium]